MLTIVGFGPTTNTAYRAAQEEFKRLTDGDPRAWIVDGERYHVRPRSDDPVICELTYTRVAGYGEEKV